MPCVVFFSEYLEYYDKERKEAKKLGAYKFFRKPIEHRALRHLCIEVGLIEKTEQD